MKESLQTQAYRELSGSTCYCGARKAKGHSFCRDCYFSLPREMQRSLYKRDGYPETYDAAKDFLRIETDRIKPNA